MNDSKLLIIILKIYYIIINHQIILYQFIYQLSYVKSYFLELKKKTNVKIRYVSQWVCHFFFNKGNVRGLINKYKN
jgi:hypothetical protein